MQHSMFLGLAEHIAGWSKDTSTQCGAVIIREDRTIASMGFNGFPRGIHDDPSMLKEQGTINRQQKLDRIIHAEMNALLFLKEPGAGMTMYVHPMLPCHRCAVHIIQSGIRLVVARRGGAERWQHSMDLTRRLFSEAGVQIVEMEHEAVAHGSGSGSSDRHSGTVIAVGRPVQEYEL